MLVASLVHPLKLISQCLQTTLLVTHHSLAEVAEAAVIAAVEAAILLPCDSCPSLGKLVVFGKSALAMRATVTKMLILAYTRYQICRFETKICSSSLYPDSDVRRYV
jgi:hypothetical protein